MIKIEGGLETVSGFRFSSINCGIRYENRLDYTIIASEVPCNAAAVFTKNKIYAAPVKICRERISRPVNAILINATNANACTGDEGYLNASALTADIAMKLNAPEESILMASTGIIGRQLPLEKMLKSHDLLLKGLSQENGASVAEAIMTTDTVPKARAAKFTCGNKEYTIAGVAKGSGMIAPDMATLLSFIITDAPVGKKDLDSIFREAADKTFNSITIDGDTSTNDTAIILSPLSNSPLTEEKDLHEFTEALDYILSELAEMLMFDGEGVTKVVRVNVSGAADKKEAVLIAKSVSNSLLVKTAIFGNDPNWGRIACAAGYSGAEVDERLLSISIEEVALFKSGKTEDVDYGNLAEILNRKSYNININIGIGVGEASILTSDLSYDYVRINAEYST
jgi:glutamate N-acetyltransferase/amino-acid N-acetyltransferase